MNQNSLSNKMIFHDGEKQPPNSNSNSQGLFGPNVAKNETQKHPRERGLFLNPLGITKMNSMLEDDGEMQKKSWG